MVINKQNRDWTGIDGKVRPSLVVSFFMFSVQLDVEVTGVVEKQSGRIKPEVLPR